MAWRDIKGWPVTRPRLHRGVLWPPQAGGWEPAPNPGLRSGWASRAPAGAAGGPRRPSTCRSPGEPTPPPQAAPSGLSSLAPARSPHLAGALTRGRVPLAGPGSQAAAGGAALRAGPGPPLAVAAAVPQGWALRRDASPGAGADVPAGSVLGVALGPWCAEGALCNGLGAGKTQPSIFTLTS